MIAARIDNVHECLRLHIEAGGRSVSIPFPIKKPEDLDTACRVLIEAIAGVSKTELTTAAYRALEEYIS